MIEEDKKEIPLTSTQIRQLTLDCFLHHKLKLRRNWGQTELPLYYNLLLKVVISKY